ncbi:ATP-binding cassette domain-containing protein [Leptotrichia sp. OH3620_COT-345]|uniref:metal ABC transporter ATP-binding protein n=1 Tax=Leptotrichia sp. OH3620_COT-345 TaxID=2491048 RepID=UPI000F6496C7|nr:ATP-binding cassette domain-containing protein [Leptotrichia sp. OH3620_COT-345]RRD39362.1 ATP-binding cassette domain-containing protein [Leptotrichia sp. OH3620_COT-345]
MKSSEKKLISVRNLSFKYHNDLILNDINFDIFKGQNVAILGRNGGGKSTLVKVILNFLKKKTGKIKFFIDKSRIGYLPQIREFDVTFPINIFDLVISGLTNRKNLFRPFNKEEKEKTEKLLKEFGIFHLKHKLISEVSGGQLQRALIARALVSSPEIIFLDEPESFLDKEFEFRLFEKIKQLSDSTLVIISHELEKIYNYVDSIFIVEENIKIYKDKTDYYKSENTNLHKH